MFLLVLRTENIEKLHYHNVCKNVPLKFSVNIQIVFVTNGNASKTLLQHFAHDV